MQNNIEIHFLNVATINMHGYYVCFPTALYALITRSFYVVIRIFHKPASLNKNTTHEILIGQIFKKIIIQFVVIFLVNKLIHNVDIQKWIYQNWNVQTSVNSWFNTIRTNMDNRFFLFNTSFWTNFYVWPLQLALQTFYDFSP